MSVRTLVSGEYILECNHCYKVLEHKGERFFISRAGIEMTATNYCNWHNDPDGLYPNQWLCPDCAHRAEAQKVVE